MERKANFTINNFIDLGKFLTYLQADSERFVIFRGKKLQCDENYNLFTMKYNDETKKQEKHYYSSMPLQTLYKVIAELRETEFWKEISKEILTKVE